VSGGGDGTGLQAQPGLIAVGDSITHGCGTAILGLHCQSWALWLAEAMGLPFLNLAQDGAVVPDVVATQLPKVQHAYAVGAVYVGVNDVRSLDFDPERYAAGLEAIVARVTAHAERTVLCTIPLDLGRPRAGAKVGGANATIRTVAERHGAVVAELADLGGPTVVQPDAVHPTAAGQLEIADRAAAALGVSPLPSSLAEVHRGPRALARFLVTSHAPAVVRDLRRRAVEDVARRRAG
jgi:lysophospholipase L1-like esterase